MSLPLRPVARLLTGVAALAALAALATSCAALHPESGKTGGVRPWQRARLASPAMTRPLSESPLSLSYRAKLLESRAGGGLPGTAAGGGCGCSQ